MWRRCERCSRLYDDMVASTVCPHERFLSPELQAQKDLALSLIGKDLRWAHDACGECGVVRIQSVGWNGMVTLQGWSGEFAPHVFVIIDAEAKH